MVFILLFGFVQCFIDVYYQFIQWFYILFFEVGVEGDCQVIFVLGVLFDVYLLCFQQCVGVIDMFGRKDYCEFFVVVVIEGYFQWLEDLQFFVSDVMQDDIVIEMVSGVVD